MSGYIVNVAPPKQFQGSNNSTDVSDPVFSPRARGLEKTIHIAVRRDALPGSGTAEDPFDGSTSSKVQALITAAAANSTFIFSAGLYSLNQLSITKAITIFGVGDETIFDMPTAAEYMFRLSGAGCTKFVVADLHMRYSGGFSLQSVEGRGIDFAAGVATACEVYLWNVTATNLCNVIFVNQSISKLTVDTCRFLYPFGQAGCRRNITDHPTVPVLCAAERTIIRNCYFNGLIDPTFNGVAGSPQAKHLTPMDGIYKTGGCNPLWQEVSNCVVENFGIEGILIERFKATGSYFNTNDGSDNYVTRVHGCTLRGSRLKSDYYQDTQPAIVVDNCIGAEVSNNLIEGAKIGIAGSFKSPNATLGDARNKAAFVRNTMRDVQKGIFLQDFSPGTVVAENTILCSSLLAKAIAAGGAYPPDYCWLSPIVSFNSGLTLSQNILECAEPLWDGTLTLASRSSNAFTVNDGTIISSNLRTMPPATAQDYGVLMAFVGGVAYALPVTAVSGNVVTIDSSWATAATAVTSGTLYWAKVSGNWNNQAGIFHDSSDAKTVFAENNIIVKGTRDIQCGAGVVAAKNNITRNCKHIVASTANVVRTGFQDNDGTITIYASLPASNLTGTVADARLTSNVMLLNGDGQIVTGWKEFRNSGVEALVFTPVGGQSADLAYNAWRLDCNGAVRWKCSMRNSAANYAYWIYNEQLAAIALAIDATNNAASLGGTLAINGTTPVAGIRSATATIDLPSIAAGAEHTATITVSGVSTTGTPSVELGFSAALPSGLVLTQQWVSGTNAVSFTVRNVSGGAIDAPSLTVRATVTNF